MVVLSTHMSRTLAAIRVAELRAHARPRRHQAIRRGLHGPRRNGPGDAAIPALHPAVRTASGVTGIARS